MGRAGGTGSLTYAAPIDTAKWFHVALVRTPDSCFYYFNGQLRAGALSNSNGSSFSAYVHLVIGAHRSRTIRFFKGRIDDLKIFDCALNSNQIDSIFQGQVPDPLPRLPQDTSLCLGDSLEIIMPDTNTINYLWDNGSTSHSRTVYQSGAYWLRIMGNNDTIQDTIVVDFLDLDSLKVPLPADTSLCFRQSFYYDFNQEPFTEVRINGSPIQNGLFHFREAGLYGIEYVHPCGVRTTDFSLSYQFCDCNLVMPDAFSPNGDGFNDEFEIKSACAGFNYQIEIFNRWGILVFSNDNIGDYWDGTSKGVDAPPGVFVYKITYYAEIGGRRIEKFEQGTVRVYR